MENPFETQATRAKRPTFLTVLCILTFIGSGWSVLGSIFNFFTADVINGDLYMETYNSMVGDIESDPYGLTQSIVDQLSTSLAHGKEIATMNLVLSLISLLGAILMFNLRRIGFFLYTAAQILMLFVMPYFAGFGFLTLVQMTLSGIVTLAFVIMYAVNLKHMR